MAVKRVDSKPFHQKLVLENFTAFRRAELDFAPGVNVVIGENGTGKTHILKALYSVHSATRLGDIDFRAKLRRVFQVDGVDALVRRTESSPEFAAIKGNFDSRDWEHRIYPDQSIAARTFHESRPIPRGTFPKEVVFIPAIDMMGHTKGFLSTYQQFQIDFDETINDIVANLLRPSLRKLEGPQLQLLSKLESAIGGKLILEGERFYLDGSRGRFAMPVVAEGLRKIATLSQLIQVGALLPGSTLFWDEPEVNLNPVLMDEVVGAILTLARSGVQVILATHSYVILKEIDLQLRKEEEVRYFALAPGDDGTIVSSHSEFAQLAPNAILDQYASLYDRELSRATRRPVTRAS